MTKRGTVKNDLPFNHHVLAWARERAGFALDEAADKVKVKLQKMEDWEEGKFKPTVRQARILADVYRRPFLEFFAKSIPDVDEVKLVPDFRLYVNKEEAENEKREFRVIQEWVEEKRLNALSLMEDLGESLPEFPAQLRFSVDDDPESAAEKTREAMQFSIHDQLAIAKGKAYSLPNILSEYIEKMGVLVMKVGKLTKFRARGMCFYVEPLPVIIFGSEAPSAQAFTIIHEFGHVITGQSGISGDPIVKGGKNVGGRGIENWCNKFSAAFLIPQSKLAEYEKKPRNPAQGFDRSRLRELAEFFRVSQHTMLIRLVELDYVVPNFYWGKMRKTFLEEEANYKGFGIPPYYGTRYVNSQGRFYTSLVLEAWGTGLISSHNAAEYMGITNLKHLQDIRSKFPKPTKSESEG